MIVFTYIKYNGKHDVWTHWRYRCRVVTGLILDEMFWEDTRGSYVFRGVYYDGLKIDGKVVVIGNTQHVDPNTVNYILNTIITNNRIF